MESVVILAVALTLAALVIKRNLLVLAAAVVIAGGESLAVSSIFPPVSALILIGSSQLLLYMGCKTVFKKQIGTNKRLKLFTELALFSAVLTLSKLLGFTFIPSEIAHNTFQAVVEWGLMLATVYMAFLLLLSPTDKVNLHELGRNLWNVAFRHGHINHANRQGGE